MKSGSLRWSKKRLSRAIDEWDANVSCVSCCINVERILSASDVKVRARVAKYCRIRLFLEYLLDIHECSKIRSVHWGT